MGNYSVRTTPNSAQAKQAGDHKPNRPWLVPVRDLIRTWLARFINCQLGRKHEDRGRKRTAGLKKPQVYAYGIMSFCIICEGKLVR
ncbi:hypothetical protein WA026_014878 [Henosepilachna vigintioctopunctata]|uniref:Uncharacterized protein n=1 Tax=Henosepilachna vigintioctopunctata TaxID=420089 RepID=A0AAW1URD5_9CUCU